MAGLSGMKEITGYYRRSEATIIYLVQNDGFPARKIKGTWESDTELIDEWRRGKILQPAKPQSTRKKKRKLKAR